MQAHVMTETHPAAGAVSRAWLPAARVDRLAVGIATLLVASGVFHLALLVGSGASWQGPLSFRKPAAFGLSFGITLLTIVGISHAVALGRRTRSWLIAAFSAASVLETFLVSLQTWRGVPSHFNVETTFDAFVTRGLAGGGIVLVALIGVLTITAFRSSSSVPPSLRLAVRAGLAALCGSMVVGGLMIARGMTLVASGAAETAYATGGSLKPIHAVTMHGILVLPALALLLRRGGWSEAQAVRVVRVAAIAYTALITLAVAASLAEWI